MNTNAESFLSLVVQDEALRKQVLGFAMQEDYRSIVALAAEKGLPCTVEELTAAYRDGKIELPEAFDEGEELSDDQLAHVAGGGASFSSKAER